VFTGQHPLSAAEHGLDGYSHVTLACPGGSDPHEHAAAVARAVAPLLAERPALVIVQGDTSVEAGLRSFDPRMPWPEEEFRTAIDARATLLFAPTDISAANLEAEDLNGRIFVTGNTGIDALLELRLPDVPRPRPHTDRLQLLVTCHRRESWGRGLRSVAEALIELSAAHPVAIDCVLHPNPKVAGTMRDSLSSHRGIRLLEPLTHREMVAAMQACDILLSDSGGMQEEAPALGVPLLVLRDKTERPEGVASGNMLLVGTERRRIVEGVERLLDPAVRVAMSRRAFPYGDGRAAGRIAGHIADFLSENAAGLPIARHA
jgi:UDP-N-acetylglucosamine 2-epimerase (non-hydrolysing)